MQMRRQHLLAIYLTSCSWGALSGCTLGQAPSDIAAADSAGVTSLTSKQLNEASGLAISRRVAGRLWAVNDGGDGPRLFALSHDGQLQATVMVDGAQNIDWEALDSAVIDGRPTLLVADIGDNAAQREHLQLYLLDEPKLDEHRASVRRTLTITVADGARDFEAAAWDPISESIILLSKRDAPPRLYSVPLNGADTVTAKFLGTVTTVPPDTAADRAADPKWGHLRDQPTALSIADDGQLIVVTTYKDSHAYSRKPEQTIATALAEAPLTIDTPQFLQTEAAALSADSRMLTVLSERLPALMATVPVR